MINFRVVLLFLLLAVGAGVNAQSCTANNYYDGSQCVACPMNTTSIAGSVGIENCLPCPTGGVTLSAGSACVAMPGYFANGQIYSPCVAGRFKSTAGNTTCSFCSSWTTSDVGSADCPWCVPGYYRNGSSCVLCPAGSYKLNSGPENNCTSCPAGTTTVFDGIALQASNGQYIYHSTNNQNLFFSPSRVSNRLYAGTEVYNRSSGAFAIMFGANYRPAYFHPTDTYLYHVGTVGTGYEYAFTFIFIGSTHPIQIQIRNHLLTNQFLYNGGGYGQSRASPETFSLHYPTNFAASAGATGPGLCLPCPAGYLSNMTHCAPCPNSTYSTARASATCLICPPEGDTLVASGATQCLARPGYFVNNTEFSGCPIGTFKNTTANSTSCTVCPPSTFANSTGQATCFACPVNMTTIVGAMSNDSCYPCANGSMTLSAGTSCVAIPGYYNSGSNYLPCAVGTFKSTAGNQTCTACTFPTSSDVGSTSCSWCAPGYYRNGTSCLPCPVGTFKLNAGGEACTACPTGTTTIYKDISIAAAGAQYILTLYAGATSVGGPRSSSNMYAGTEVVNRTDGAFHLQVTSNWLSFSPSGSKIYYGSSMGSGASLTFGFEFIGSTYPIAMYVYNFVSNPRNYMYQTSIYLYFRTTSPDTYYLYYPADFAASTGANSPSLCLPCPAGMISNVTHCAYCPNSTYSTARASATCLICPPEGDTLIASGATQCLARPGYFANNTEFSRCPLGSFKNTTANSTSCTTCPPSTFANSTGQATCFACPVNMTSLAGAMSNDSCYPCANGSMTLSAGTSCVAMPGYYNSGSNYLPCAVGTFKSTAGNQTCTACTFPTSSDVGSTSCSWCAPGYYRNGTSCLPCPVGTYKLNAGGEACTSCPAGTTTIYKDISIAAAGAQYILTQYAGSTSVGGPRSSSNMYTGTEVVNRTDGAFHLQVTSNWLSFSPSGSKIYYVSSMGSGASLTFGFEFIGSTHPIAMYVYNFVSNPRNYMYQSSIYLYFRTTSPDTYYLYYPADFAASTGATSPTLCLPAPAGMISNVTHFTYCPEGTYAPGRASPSCLLCPQGRYANLTGTVTCTACPTGYSTPGNGSILISECTICNSGYYRNDTSTTNNTCVGCPLGTFSPSPGLNENCTLCQPGSYAASLGQSTCTLCPAGSYSNVTGANSSSTCVQCPLGTFSTVVGALNNSVCMPCSTGYWTSATGASVCNVCDIGYYRNGTSPVCIPCLQGSWKSTTGNGTCTACANIGTTTEGVGALNSSFCTMCVPGYKKTGALTCVACEAGTYRTTINNATTCVPCGVDTYSTTVGATRDDVCLECTYDSTTNGTVGCNNANACLCNIGFTGTGSTGCFPCGSGRYKSIIGPSSCLNCPTGTYQTLFAQANCSLCGAGTFQNDTGRTTCRLCPPGTYSTSIGANSSVSCLPCNSGTFSNVPGASNCSLCQIGTYQNRTGQTSCVNCIATATTLNTGAVNVSQCICNPGYFGMGASSCQQCPSNTFKNTTGNANSCISCNANSGTNGTIGSISITACVCDAGYYGNGTSQCTICPVDTYKSLNGDAASCINCVLHASTEGVIGANTSSACMCNAGYFGSGSSLCSQCPVNTYKDTPGDAASCIGCVEFASTIGVIGANVSTACKCNPGYFGIGSNICSECPENTYKTAFADAPSCTNCIVNSGTNGTTGSIIPDACLCDAGFTGRGSTNCSACLTGTFKNVIGTSSCTSCAPGSYQNLTGQSTCLPCDIGTFASLSGRSSCSLCPVGRFENRTGSTVCQSCPVDTFNTMLGSSSITDCLNCAITAATNGTTGNDACRYCKPGYFGSGGNTCSRCNATNTYFSVENTNTTSCLECPIGSFLNTTSNNTLQVNCICEPGYYAGGENGICVMCPSDTFSSTSGRPLECTPCPEGLTTNGLLGQDACGFCAAEYGGTAPNCVKCDAGFEKKAVGNYKCNTTPSANPVAAALGLTDDTFIALAAAIGVFLIGSVAAVFAVRKALEKRRSKKRIVDEALMPLKKPTNGKATNKIYPTTAGTFGVTTTAAPVTAYSAFPTTAATRPSVTTALVAPMSTKTAFV